MIRRSLQALAAAVLVAVFAGSAVAGSYVEIRAEALPRQIQAGKATTLAFTVSFPNGEPVTELKPVVRLSSGRVTREVRAIATKTPGAYLATVTLPRAGEWLVVVDSRHCGNTRTLAPVTAVTALASR